MPVRGVTPAATEFMIAVRIRRGTFAAGLKGVVTENQSSVWGEEYVLLRAVRVFRLVRADGLD